jgi:hypothetical protein
VFSFLGGVTLTANNSTLGDQVLLDFTTTMSNSLVGFSGGTIDGGNVTNGVTQTLLFDHLSGTIAPAPIPDRASSLALLALGISGLLALRRRWKAA